MNMRHLAITFIIAVVAIMTISTVQATPTLSIKITDSNGNVITDTTVPISTIASISAYYADSSGNKAQAMLTVFYDNGLGPLLVATLYSGTVNNGDTVTRMYTLTSVGTYEFRWTCTPISVAAQSGSLANCPPAYQQRCQVNTSPQNRVPEPLPAAGLTIGLLALGVFAFKRKRPYPAKIV